MGMPVVGIAGDVGAIVAGNCSGRRRAKKRYLGKSDKQSVGRCRWGRKRILSRGEMGATAKTGETQGNYTGRPRGIGQDEEINRSDRLINERCMEEHRTRLRKMEILRGFQMKGHKTAKQWEEARVLESEKRRTQRRTDVLEGRGKQVNEVSQRPQKKASEGA